MSERRLTKLLSKFLAMRFPKEFAMITYHCLTTFFFTLGVIKNTIPLNYSVSHSYILSVVAFDCGQKRSEPLLVTVEVKKACSTGWTGEFLVTKLTMSKIKFQPLNFFSESSGDIIDVASVAKSCQDYTAAMFLGEPGGTCGST